MNYDLLKKAFKLEKKEKETLLSNFDKFIDIFKEEEKIKNASSRQNVLKTVLARGLHDPETPDEMLGLIDLLEKFVGIDNDISHENISIFLKPMVSSAQKIMIRPCKIIGLIRKLDRLSRQYKREKKNESLEVSPIKEEFCNSLGQIKLKIKKPESTSVSHIIQKPFSYNIDKKRHHMPKM
jgi:hypothetical protein